MRQCLVPNESASEEAHWRTAVVAIAYHSHRSCAQQPSWLPGHWPISPRYRLSGISNAGTPNWLAVAKSDKPMTADPYHKPAMELEAEMTRLKHALAETEERDLIKHPATGYEPRFSIRGFHPRRRPQGRGIQPTEIKRCLERVFAIKCRHEHQEKNRHLQPYRDQ